MIELRPGQLCTINHVIYRAVKRNPTKFLECDGCSLNNPFMCPNYSFANESNPLKINCDSAGFVLKRIKP